MTKKSRTDEELWAAVQQLDGDLLDRSAPAEVAEGAVRGLGLDPAALRAEGEALVRALLDEQRRGWMTTARRNIDMMRRRARATRDYSSMDRQMLLDELELRRRDPGAGGEIRAAFRDRRAEESSEGDLRALLEEMDRVAAMHSPDGEDE